MPVHHPLERILDEYIVVGGLQSGQPLVIAIHPCFRESGETGFSSSGFRRNWKTGVSQRLESQPSSPENAVPSYATLHYWLLCGLTLRRKCPRLHRPQRLVYKKRMRSFAPLESFKIDPCSIKRANDGWKIVASHNSIAVM
jgi:hypothetical protein